MITLLIQQGKFETARAIAEELIADSDSIYFESVRMQGWIDYIDAEIRRNNTFTEMMVHSIDGEERSTEPNGVVVLMRATPDYPQAAAESGLEGFATVYFVIDTNGKPKNITVHESSDPVFDNVAIAAINDFRYLPIPNEIEHANKFTFELAP